MCVETFPANTLRIFGPEFVGMGVAAGRAFFRQCDRIGCDPTQAIAVGDGANDLMMMGAAGLSVAYHAKPKVREQARIAVDAGGLDRLLECFQP